MQLTETIRSLSKQLAYVILAQAGFLFLYSLSRERIDLLYSISLYQPLLGPLLLVPIIVAFFLSTKYGRPASIALIGILPAEAIVLLLDRLRTPPRIIRIGSASYWRMIFEGSFGLTLILEGLGFWLAIRMLREIHRQIEAARMESPAREGH